MKIRTPKLIECPRDAMQGLKEFIPTEKKAEYINSLLKVGFDTIDFGSFVSPLAIPQMRDTADVLKKLKLPSPNGKGQEVRRTKLLAIIANTRGAEDACQFDEITYLGFPFSISETFQRRNTNSTMEESLARVAQISNLCAKHNKEIVIYISMAFGNPYGDEWNKDIAIHWTEKLVKNFGVKIIALADTIGVSNTENISYMFSNLIPEFPDVEFGAHLHTTPEKWREKIIAAVENGCERFDCAINGFGGCPMASDKLVGNMPTENIVSFFGEKNMVTEIDLAAFEEARKLAMKIFPS